MRLGHYVGRPGGIMERFSFGGPNDTFNKRGAAHLDVRRHAHLDDRRMRSASAANSVATSSTPTCPRSRPPSSRSSTTSPVPARAGAEADTQFGITDKRFRFNDFNLFLADDWRLGHGR